MILTQGGGGGGYLTNNNGTIVLPLTPANLSVLESYNVDTTFKPLDEAQGPGFYFNRRQVGCLPLGYGKCNRVAYTPIVEGDNTTILQDFECFGGSQSMLQIFAAYNDEVKGRYHEGLEGRSLEAEVAPDEMVRA